MSHIFRNLQTEFWGTEWYCLYGAPIGAINGLSFNLLNRKIYTFILWEPHFIPFSLSSFWTSNPLSNIPTDCFLLFQTTPVYFLLIPWLLTKLTRFHYLRSNGKNTYKNVRKNTVIVDFIIFHFLKASFHPFPTVIFLDFQSSFQYPNGLIFTILNKISLFPPYSLIINGINKISLPAK